MDTGIVRLRRLVRPLTIGALCLLLAVGCSAAVPASDGPSDAPGSWQTEPAASRSATPAGTEPGMSFGVVESADPAAALIGRAVEGLGEGGVDAVLRIGAEGFRLPDGERLYDVDGDRVLAARAGADGAAATLIVRDLDGQLVREIAMGMEVPQTGIVRGEDVYFAGVDLAEDATGSPIATDRGAWVAHEDAPPVPVLAAEDGPAAYTAIERSPDGRTIGIWRCGEICATILIGAGGDIVEVPEPGLIALTDEVALVIGEFSDVTAYAIDDGAELWQNEIEGAFYERYATTDGDRIVLSAIEDAGDDESTTDQLRIELLDARSGAVERSVLVSTEEQLLWVAPSLSSDRYVAILDAILPDADEGPHLVHIVDLEAGRLLDITLMLGDVP